MPSPSAGWDLLPRGCSGRDGHFGSLVAMLELSPTDAIVVGPPSVMSSWAFKLVRAAAECAQSEIRLVDRNDEIGEVPAARHRLRMLCLAQYPSPSLTAIIRGGRIPTIACLDDAIDAVRYLQESVGCTFLEALRAQTAAATVCGAFFDNSSVLLVDRRDNRTIDRIAEQILDHLGLGMTSTAKRALIEQFLAEPGAKAWSLERALARQVAGYLAPGKPSTISAKEAVVIEQVLTPMMRMSVRRDIGPICWPSPVFLFGDRPNEPAPLVADVTGAARIIFYGPYFHLPAGRWRAQVVLGFSHDIFGTPFSIEVHGSTLVAKAIVKPEGECVFRASFSMIHTRPQDPVELRVRSEEGAIEGRIGLARALFSYED